jgi:hypothetical protein
MAEAGRRLEATLGPAEDVGIDVTVQRLRGRTRRRSTPGCFPPCQHSALVSPPCQHSALVSPPSSLGPEFPRSSLTCSTFGLPSPAPSGPQLYPRRKVQCRSRASDSCAESVVICSVNRQNGRVGLVMALAPVLLAHGAERESADPRHGRSAAATDRVCVSCGVRPCSNPGAWWVD